MITRLSCEPGDLTQHTLKIQLKNAAGPIVAEAPDHQFQYGYKIDSSGPGGFVLTTEFDVDTQPIGLPIRGLVLAFLDGAAIASSPLTLLRG